MGAEHPSWYDPTELGIGHDSAAETDLSLGDTDIDPPWQFRESEAFLRHTNPDDPHKYAAVAGRLSTREEIIKRWLQSDRFGAPVPIEETSGSEPCVVVTPGGQAAMHHAVNTALDAGEKALLIEPYYPYHAKSVRIFAEQERIETVSTNASEGFQPPVERVAKAIESEPIGALVLCSPSNPSGTCYDDDWLSELSTVIDDAEINVISDEVYAFLTYDATHHSIAAYPGMSERTFVVGSFSKVFGLSGWRLGFVRCPAKYFDPLEDVTDSIAMQASTPGQVILEYALRDGGLARLDEVRDRLRSRLDTLIEPFQASPKISVHRPAGGFYLLPAVDPDYGADSTELGGYEAARERLPDSISPAPGDCLHSHLLDDADVEGTMGRCFGAPETVRLAFGQTPINELEAAADRIALALERF